MQNLYVWKERKDEAPNINIAPISKRRCIFHEAIYGGSCLEYEAVLRDKILKQ